MGQLQLFSRSDVAAMRDKTKARNYSPIAEEFRREHEGHREWGLRQRHARKERRLQAAAREVAAPPTSTERPAVRVPSPAPIPADPPRPSMPIAASKSAASPHPPADPLRSQRREIPIDQRRSTDTTRPPATRVEASRPADVRPEVPSPTAPQPSASRPVPSRPAPPQPAPPQAAPSPLAALRPAVFPSGASWPSHFRTGRAGPTTAKPQAPPAPAEEPLSARWKSQPHRVGPGPARRRATPGRGRRPAMAIPRGHRAPSDLNFLAASEFNIALRIEHRDRMHNWVRRRASRWKLCRSRHPP